MSSVEQTGKCTAVGSTDELIGLLAEQRELYTQLGRLVENQRAWITGDEPERLLAALGERQCCIDRLESSASRLRAYQENWEDVRRGLTAAELERVGRLVGEVNALIAGILQRDEADAQLLAARKGSTSQALGALRTARQAGAAYSTAGYGPPSSMGWRDA